MKVLNKSEMVNRNKTHRAYAEQYILLNTSHPFIVPLYHTFQTEHNLYFIMEYCNGGEFFRKLQGLPGKCISEEQARFYSGEVVTGVEYLHLEGFVWRDLKPENILLHSTGHIMLTDFDLSTHTNPSPPVLHNNKINTSTCPSRANSFVGTEEYIAPEILTGIHHSAPVDWWTVGIFIYEMLFSTTPFKGSDRPQTFEYILNKQPKFPPCSNKVRDLISKLLNKNERKRLGSNGASEIKSHPFFKEGWIVGGRKVGFELLRCVEPPLGVPVVDGDDDTRNFRRMTGDGDGEIEEVVVEMGRGFVGFECVSVMHAGW
jgi:serine/threonine protein kinase